MFSESADEEAGPTGCKRARVDNAATFETGFNVTCAEFNWKINNFHVLRNAENLIGLEHIVFQTVDGNGSRTTWKASLVNCPRDISVKVELTERIRQEKQKFVNFWLVEVLNKDGSLWAQRAIGQEKKECYYFKGLIPKAAETEWPLDDNATLTIRLSLKMYYIPEFNLMHRQQQLKDAIGNITASLEGDQGTSDVTIISEDGVNFFCHRCVLSKRSPVFAAMFRANMKEKESGIVRCSDLSGKCLGIFIHFIYTGDLSEEWTQRDVIGELTYAADKYQQVELLQFLDETLARMCKAEDAPQLLFMANQFNLKKAQVELAKRVEAGQTDR